MLNPENQFTVTGGFTTVPNIYVTESFTTTTQTSTLCPIQIIPGTTINITNSNSGFTYVLQSQDPVYMNPRDISPGYFNYIKAGQKGGFAVPVNITDLPLNRLALWLDAADPYGNGIYPSNGTILSNWVDKSGSGNSGIATGTPVFLNSQIIIDGSSYFTSQYTQQLIGSRPIETVFIVATVPDTTSSTVSFLSDPNAATYSRKYEVSANVQRYRAVSGESFNATLPVSASLTLFDYTYNNVGQGSGLRVDMYLNNSIDPVTLGSEYNQAIPTTTAIGKTSTSSYTISEIIIFSDALSSNDRLRVEAYLNSKWNLSRLSATGTEYSTPRLWLDALDPYGNGITPSSGTVISTWVDKSGFGNNAVASGSISFVNNGMLFTGSQY